MLGTDLKFLENPTLKTVNDQSLITLGFVSGELVSLSDAEKVRNSILKWAMRVAEERGLDLPPEAKVFHSFEVRGGQGRLTSIWYRNDDDGANSVVWALQLRVPDADDARREWITEVTLMEGEDVSRFGVRCECLTPNSGEYLSHVPGMPRLVAQIAGECGLIFDGRVSMGEAKHADTAEKTEDLMRLILDPHRKLPVVVISPRLSASDDRQYAVDPSELAAQMTGLAHVYTVTAETTYRLTERWGKTFSVYNGAIRTYFPDFDTMSQAPNRHPLVLPTRVDTMGSGEQSWMAMSRRKVAQYGVKHLPAEDQPPSFDSVRRRAASQRLATTAKSNPVGNGILESLMAQVEAFREERDVALDSEAQLQSRLNAIEKQLRLADQNLIEAKDEIKRLNKVLNSLGARDLPASYAELPEWVEKHHAGRLELHTRARRTLKDAQYEDLATVAEALDLLAGPYLDSRKGVEGAFQEFETALAELGLDLQRTGDEGHLSSFGDTYFVLHGDQRVFMEWHLKNRGGSGRDPRRVVRIYFFWDTANERVVVASLPGHLQNAKT